MLIPRKVKHRKQHHPKRSGAAKGGTKVTFGEFGIQALEPAYVTNRQIESARIAINRHIRRGGKVWINIYPDRPLTKKPAETRMGSGKGSPEWWIANVKPGRVLFELSYPDEKTAKEALTRAIRGSDLAVHFRPEALLLVLPGLGVAAAHPVAERVRAALQAGARHGVAVAGGVVELLGDETFESVVTRVHDKVQQARDQGHNRVA